MSLGQEAPRERVVLGWDGQGGLRPRRGGGTPHRPRAKPQPMCPSRIFLGFGPGAYPPRGTVGWEAKGAKNDELLVGRGELGC